ncbi:hypothetical protein LCL95_08770 [Bacillus timonensis]|nr:hypothetical protein [Bacillus timonensis]
MKELEHEFCCPEYVPVGEEDDFCIPKDCCPERLETPKFPSSNSCLPKEQLEELELKIAETNEKLLDIALSGKRTPREIFQRAFEGLKGLRVKIEVDAPRISNPEKNVVLTGTVHLVGFDFVLLRRDGKEYLVLYEKILFITLSNGKYAEPIEEPELLDIAPCLRRRITFHFGETVSSSPELIQIFYRLTFKIYLQLLIGKRVKVNVGGKRIRARMDEVHDESLTLCKKQKKNKKKIEVPIENVCYVIVK